MNVGRSEQWMNGLNVEVRMFGIGTWDCCGNGMEMFWEFFGRSDRRRSDSRKVTSDSLESEGRTVQGRKSKSAGSDVDIRHSIVATWSVDLVRCDGEQSAGGPERGGILIWDRDMAYIDTATHTSLLFLACTTRPDSPSACLLTQSTWLPSAIRPILSVSLVPLSQPPQSSSLFVTQFPLSSQILKKKNKTKKRLCTFTLACHTLRNLRDSLPLKPCVASALPIIIFHLPNNSVQPRAHWAFPTPFSVADTANSTLDYTPPTSHPPPHRLHHSTNTFLPTSPAYPIRRRSKTCHARLFFLRNGCAVRKPARNFIRI